jgi:hypothetical protein
MVSAFKVMLEEDGILSLHMLNYSQNSGKPLFNYRGGVEDI